MIKKTLLIAILAILAAPSISSAKDMAGKYGLGYFNAETPVGGRYWISSNAGFDLGVGFDMSDQGEETYSDFYLGAGFNYIIYDTPKANFFIRPGVIYGMLDARPYGINSDSKWSMISLSLMPAAEVFLTDNFSIEAGHGFEIELISYPDETEFGALAGESRTNIRTLDGSISYLGFHFYFK